MSELVLVQAAQTAALLTVALAVIWAFFLLRRELRQAKEGLNHMREAFRSQKDLEEAIERIWRHIGEIELRQGLRGDAEQFGRIKRLLDAFEAAMKPETPPQP